MAYQLPRSALGSALILATALGLVSPPAVALDAGVPTSLGPASSARGTAAEATSPPENKRQRALQRWLLAPQNVSERVRRTLQKRMKDHGRAVRDLWLAVALLDYPKVEALARSLENEPRIDAAAGETAGLTEPFFQLQDELRADARELSESARKHDAKGTVEAMGRTAESCVACHILYRAPRP